MYQLQIPTGNPAVIDRSLLILEDWAHNVSFDPVEIDKERGVILEEWRLGLGADERIQDAQFPILLKGSRYAERLPIGKPEIIQNVNHARLKQFYTDWYRPDLMAVVAVGDFDKSTIEAQIRSRFGSIPAASSPKPRPAYAVPDQPGTVYSVITDPEATQYAHQRVQQDGRAPAVVDWRLPAAHGRAAVQRHAVGAARRDRAGAECAVSHGPDRAAGSSCAPKRRRPWMPSSRRAASNGAWRRSSPRSTASPDSASPRRS